jgi:hypothetical protein
VISVSFESKVCISSPEGKGSEFLGARLQSRDETVKAPYGLAFALNLEKHIESPADG